MNVQDVIREMRLYTEDDNYGPDVGRWVIALEAAMREPVATIIEGEDGFRYCDWDSALETGMKLYALPPDAQAEIERLQRKLMRVHNFPLHPGRHGAARPDEADDPASWRHGWFCAIEAMLNTVLEKK